MNIRLEIGKSVIEKLKADHIPMNLAGSVLMILMALYHDNYAFLEIIDDKNKEKQIMLLYQLLYRKGYIEETEGEEMEEALYKLTEKGITFIRFVEAVSITVDTNEVIKNNNDDGLATWIDEYINLFPEPVRGQRNLRGNRQSCFVRMRWFLNNHNYDKNHILAATEEYINSQAVSPEGHKFTQTSDYFIKKGTGVDMTSRLATACESYDPENITIKQDYSRDSI